MDSLYYTVEEHSDGWHAYPTDSDDDAVDDDRVFPSHDDALAWCHGNGLIPLHEEREMGYAFDLGDPFV